MKSRLTLGVLMGLIFATGCTQDQQQQYPYQLQTLDNGLRVITLEDHATPVVAVQVWYHVGAVDEDPARQGFAHMFEHMMFRGTDRLGPKDHFEYIRQSGGDCNAYTSFDQTVYVNRVPANQLELVLWLEAERMSFLKVDADGYKTERKVVEEERRLGLNRPYGTVFEIMLPAIFAKHPYRWTPIGRIPHLRAASVDEVRAFWQRYYLPNNAVLVIVGDESHEKMQALARQYFHWIPAGPQPPHVAPAAPSEGPGELVIREPRGPLPRVSLIYRSVPGLSADETALDFLEVVLGDGQSSRLNQDLVKKKRLAVEVDVSSWGLEHAGLFSVSATLPPEGNAATAAVELKGHIDRVRDELITENEWTKARNQLLRRAVTRSMTVASKAGLLGRYASVYDQLARINEQFDEIRQVTREDVQRVARKYLVPANLTQVTIVPDPTAPVQSDEGTAPDATVDMSTPDVRAGLQRPTGFPLKPPIQPLLDAIPQIDKSELTLANGLKVVVVPNHDLPFVRLTLGLKPSSWCEDVPGTVFMATEMITRGTDRHNAAELAEILDRHAITLDGSAAMDVASVNASCLTEHANLAAGLMAEVVRRSTFPEDEFAILQQQQINQLRVKMERPSYLADREFRKLVFGNHPYARSPMGWLDDMEKLTAKDAAAWWRKFVRPQTSVLYIAGDLSPAAAFELAGKAFGDWEVDGPVPQVTTPALPEPAETRIFLVDRPGLVQSEIRLGHVGITRKHDDYFTSRVLTQIFGGAFNSRLMQSLRIDKGLTYGVGGSFIANRFGGEFRVRTFTKAASTAQAVEAVLEQIRILASTEPTAEELGIARSYLTGSLAVSRETPQAFVNDLWKIDYCELPEDYYQQYLQGVKQTTARDITRVAKELIHPDRLTILVVGDAKVVQADLEKIAPVTLLKD